MIANSYLNLNERDAEDLPGYLLSLESLKTVEKGVVEYDPLMQVKGIMVKDPADNILMNYTYTRDKEGNILSKNTQAGNFNFSYDKTYQLLKTIYPDKTETFTYDPAGNRMNQETVILNEVKNL